MLRVRNTNHHQRKSLLLLKPVKHYGMKRCPIKEIIIVEN